MLKLSIVIPTKDRYQTLFPVVDAILDNLEGNDYEIVISDNTINNEDAIIRFSQIIYKDKISYFHTAIPLSQSGNSERAISCSVGDYVVFIGDDDLVSPFIWDAVELMSSRNIESLIFSPANFYWEGVKFASNTRIRKAESMLIPKRIGGSIVKLNSAQVLQRVLNNGGVAIENLPQQYHAIVSRNALTRLKMKFGCYIPGPCPDMSLAVGLSYVIDTYYFINYPFTVTGVSKHSAAGLGVRNEHVGRLEEQTFLPSNILDLWNPMLPKIWTACTIWAQSLIEVMRKAGDNRDIFYPEFYARMLVREPYAKEYVKPLVDKYLNENPEMKKTFYKALAKQRIKMFLIFWINIVLGGTAALHNKLVIGIKNPKDCMMYLKKQTRIKG